MTERIYAHWPILFDMPLIYRVLILILYLKKCEYGLVEIKIGGDRNIEEASKNLLKLSSIIDTSKQKGPAFKMVLIGVGHYAYTRQDGVYVVPITCLKN